MLLVRSMAPDVLAVDEIGRERDMYALQYALRCGCQVVATIHSRDLDELFAKPKWKEYRREKLFERYVVLTLKGGRRSISIFNGELEQLC